MRYAEYTYSSYLTVRRIADELQGVFALIAVIAIVAFVPRNMLEGALFAFVLTYPLVAFFLPKLIRRVVPPHVRERLPLGRYDGASIPGAPHTYGDLVRMWRDPSWQCAHVVPANRQAPVETRRMLRFVGMTFGVVVLAGIASFLFRRTDVAIAAAVIALLGQIAEARRIRAVVESNAHTSPTVVEIWVVGLVGVAALGAVTAVALARALG